MDAALFAEARVFVFTGLTLLAFLFAPRSLKTLVGPAFLAASFVWPEQGTRLLDAAAGWVLGMASGQGVLPHFVSVLAAPFWFGL